MDRLTEIARVADDIDAESATVFLDHHVDLGSGDRVGEPQMEALMSQPLYRDGHVYLLDKRHGLTCFELATGKKKWDDDNRMAPKGRNPQASMVWLNDEDRAIVLNSDGDLILVRLNLAGYVEETRANIIGRTWAHPAYAGNCVYARSDTELVCVVLPRTKQ